jgi:hypothetical protein
MTQTGRANEKMAGSDQNDEVGGVMSIRSASIAIGPFASREKRVFAHLR